jgi:hypothetical protein
VPDNPYKSPATTRNAPRRFSNRLLIEGIFVFATGVIGASCVYLGEAKKWQDFSVYTGYWGTHFLDSGLYAMGDPTVALVIVAFFWFLYGSLMALVLVSMTRLCSWLLRRIASSNNEAWKHRDQ